MDEEKRVAQAAAGDRAAFEQLVVKYQKPIYNLALRMLSNTEDAFDITQDVFLKAWQSLPNLKSGTAFSTWLYRMCGNACIDFLRRAKRRRTLPLEVQTDSEDSWEPALPDPSPTPEELTVQKEQRQALQQAFSQLETGQRQLLTLRVIDELSYQQIAQILQVPEGTVKSRLSRAREALRKKLLQSGNPIVFQTSEKEKGEVRVCSAKKP